MTASSTFVSIFITEQLHMQRSVICVWLSWFLGRFAFNTPFTPRGKAHGDVTEQYMRKTILTSMECFPYVKRRSKIIKLDTVSCFSFT